jgi:uncharacterized protein with HEPN domain
MWRDDARLLDMLLAAKEVGRYTEGVTLEEFQRNRMLQHAVLRLVEIVGEAARNISAEFKTAHPEIPWSGIISMRNRLAHEYFRVTSDKVWEVVDKDLPALVGLIEPLVLPDEPDVAPEEGGVE